MTDGRRLAALAPYGALRLRGGRRCALPYGALALLAYGNVKAVVSLQ